MTPKLETKDFIFMAQWHGHQHIWICFLRPKGNTKRARWHSHVQWVEWEKRRLEFMELESSIMDNKHACPLVRREMRPSLSCKVICYLSFLKRVWNKRRVTCRRTKNHGLFFFWQKLIFLAGYICKSGNYWTRCNSRE